MWIRTTWSNLRRNERWIPSLCAPLVNRANIDARQTFATTAACSEHGSTELTLQSRSTYKAAVGCPRILLMLQDAAHKVWRQTFSSLSCSECICQLVHPMDFRFARNLSALSRAQQLVADALLQVGACTDSLNREVILPVSDSDEAEQLLEAARTNLLRIIEYEQFSMNTFKYKKRVLKNQ